MIIGLTGGMGAGKSTVADIFRNKGFFVIDADKIARQLVFPGGRCLNRLKEEFGSEIIDEKGVLCRQKLADIAFLSEVNKQRLDAIMQAEITAEIEKVVESCGCSDIIIDAPLLFESGYNRRVDLSILVVCGLDTKIERIKNRDGLTETQIKDRITKQMNDEDKMNLADFVIKNDGSIEELKADVEEVINICGL